ncbi:AEC family transporter [Corynebacterium uterequi]|uniref:Putative permease n=1 Tax=Corynebacterium uterequi TaxID=1072256 RepID=A0A0G3HC73_9CORY|nr:AEC family transporter [Corynebacterium uterequi]AKK10290.1 putative permease [Corynebacterium uterequi]
MQGVITGFAIIFVVIATGWLLSQRGIIGKGESRLMFNQVAFYAATPALIFSSVATSDPGHFTSPVVLIVTLATILTSVIYVVISRIGFRQDLPTTSMGAAAASYYNSVNIGLPVSIYALGEATHVVPTLIVQMAVFTPIILAFLGSADAGSAGTPAWRRFLASVRTALISPVVVASFLGLAVAAWDIPVPDVIMEPAAILGGASIPMILMSFGASLSGGGVLRDADNRPGAITATALKVAGMPVVAWLLCLAFGVGGDLLYAAVILSALPTAQNIYNYAATYRRGEIIARDTVFLSTFLSMPAMLIIAAIFGR